MSTCKHCGSPKPPGLLARKLAEARGEDLAFGFATSFVALVILTAVTAFAAYQFREQSARFERERVAPTAGVEAGGK